MQVYYGTEGILFLIVKIWEQLGENSALGVLRYSIIAYNFLMIAYLYLRYGHRMDAAGNLIPLAFAMTLVADTFLCLIDGIYIMGFLFFFLVESVYMLYLKVTYISLSARLGIYSVLLFAAGKMGLLNLSNALALANMAQLTINVFCAWRQRRNRKSRDSLLFAWGITLFFICDFSIGIRTLVEVQPVHDIAAFAVWTCYIPAQVLLLSAYAGKID